MVAANRIILCGGGTGGHLFPGIAIALAIRKRIPESTILFVGTRRGLEERVLPRYGFEFQPIRSAGFKNLNISKKLKALLILPIGILEGFRLIRSFKPLVVIGLGGYSAFPLMIAAAVRRVHRTIQEQNVIPGLTNRILAPFAHRIFISFDLTARYFPAHKTLLTGNPIRDNLCVERRGLLTGNVRHLLVLGGSLGAHFINQLCIATLPPILQAHPEMHIHIQTGKADYWKVHKAFEKFDYRVKVSPFIEEMSSAYSQADLIIARAGATTLAEISACGIPAILIPFPYAANDHQTENARFFSSRGGALLLQEKEIEERGFTSLLNELLTHPEKLREMAKRMKALGRPDAADRIVSALFPLTSSGGEKS